MRMGIVVLAIVAIAAGAWWYWHERVEDGDSPTVQPFDDQGERVLKMNADDLKQTTVTPHLECPIADGKNVLWCSTFQLTWNEACRLFGEDVRLADAPPMVAIMNKKTATKADIDEASYVALAGFVEDGILDKISDAVREKFGEDVSGDMAAFADTGSALAAYAFLSKNLRFEIPFEPLDNGELKFRGTPVMAFGLSEPLKEGKDRLTRQVVLYYDRGMTGDEGIYEFKTTSSDDRLILAMVKPAMSLGETVAAVHARMATARQWELKMLSSRIMVPKLKFDVVKDYADLSGKSLNNVKFRGWPVVVARQSIRFQLDEHGATLKSRAGWAAANGHPNCAPPIFNKPFLIMLQRKDAKMPYFALWVDNVELLMPIE